MFPGRCCAYNRNSEADLRPFSSLDAPFHEPVPDDRIQIEGNPGAGAWEDQKGDRVCEGIAEQPRDRRTKDRHTHQRAECHKLNISGAPETSGVHHPPVLGDEPRNDGKIPGAGSGNHHLVIGEKSGDLAPEDEDEDHEKDARHVGDGTADADVGCGEIFSAGPKALTYETGSGGCYPITETE